MSDATPVTASRMLALALPMTLSHMTTPLLGVVGAAAIGRLGDPAMLGALALGSLVFDFLFWSFGSLRMATAGMTAQAVGGGDAASADLILARALLAATVIGAAMILLQRPISAIAFAGAGASPAVTGALAAYFSVRIFAAPFTLGNYAILGAVLGRGRSGVGLALQVAINGVNIGLTVALVLGAGFGVAGAAAASLLAEVAGLVLGIAVLARIGARPWRAPLTALLERVAALRTLAVNRDVTIRSVCLMVAYAVFASRGARSGDTVLAANAVLQNVLLVGSFFLDGFATAAETLCGQRLGADDEPGFRRAVRLALLFSAGFGAAVALLSLGGGAMFIAAVTTSPEVRELADRFLPYAALAPLIGAPAFAFDGIYVGATWTAAMRNAMLVALLLYGLVLVATDSAGNHGLWSALLVFLAVRGVGQMLLYPTLVRRAFKPRPERAAERQPSGLGSSP